MSDTVKLIIEIDKDLYEATKRAVVNPKATTDVLDVNIANGIPLDDIDSDETRAYFDGQAYGWEEGRKDLCDEISAEIKDLHNSHMINFVSADGAVDTCLEIIKKYKGDKE